MSRFQNRRFCPVSKIGGFVPFPKSAVLSHLKSAVLSCPHKKLPFLPFFETYSWKIIIRFDLVSEKVRRLKNLSISSIMTASKWMGFITSSTYLTFAVKIQETMFNWNFTKLLNFLWFSWFTFTGSNSSFIDRSWPYFDC